MNTIYLQPDMVPAQLRGAYTGRKFAAVVTETVTIPIDAGLWSGGSRDVYSVVSLDHGTRELPGQSLAPWDRSGGDRVCKLVAGIVVVRHSMFCGKDHGLTFYVHPDNATKLLPAPAAELSAHESIVLKATAHFKSSYAGKDRYQMAKENERYGSRDHSGLPFPTRDEWNAAKATLISKGFLNKAGAITVAGRNAVKS